MSPRVRRVFDEETQGMNEMDADFDDLCERCLALPPDQRRKLLEYLQDGEAIDAKPRRRTAKDSRRRAYDDEESGPVDFPGMPRTGGSMSGAGEDRRHAFDSAPRRNNSFDGIFGTRNIRSYER